MNEPLLPPAKFNPHSNVQSTELSYEINNVNHSGNLMAPVAHQQAAYIQAGLKPDRNIFDCVTIGDIPVPFIEPNVHPSREIEDIQNVLSDSKDSGFTCGDICCMAACGVTLIGLCSVYNNTVLINSNQYGFIIDSGKVVFLKPGWHFVGYPLMNGLTTRDINSEYIQVNNLQIIRIRQDEVGIGFNNTNLEILLPGTHLRTNGSYAFIRKQKVRDDLIEGPVKIKTVKTGTVCICYNNGVAEILSEGRYSINSNGFVIGGTLDITQQNLKFSKHRVLLEGGINMLVEGLLTYQIKDVTKLIKNVDIALLNRYLEDVMKADLTKVFSTIHLEQIASTTYNEIKKSDERAAETRLFIYESIMKMIKPQADQWGITIINFQLESTQLADQKYSNDYETASLQIAKSKAELKAQEAQNVIRVQKAETEANVMKIQAEADRNIQLIRARASADSTIMQAEAAAQAILKEGEARASAAGMMTSPYGQELALLAEKSKIAEGLKIHTLVMGGAVNGNGKSMIDNVVPVLNL
jgi:regulator of protease activity HflC (stomatin/prohibitin superfamily)